MEQLEFTDFDSADKNTWPPDNGEYLAEYIWIHPTHSSCNRVCWEIWRWDIDAHQFSGFMSRSITKWAKLPPHTDGITTFMKEIDSEHKWHG